MNKRISDTSLKILCPVIAAAAVALAAPTAQATLPTPISLYKFEEGAGTSTADEIRGATFEGTIVGGATWVPGRFGTALQFDGSSGYVYAPVAGKGTTNFTITAWVWFNNYTQWGTIVKNWGNTVPGTFHLGLDNNTQKLSNYLGFTDNSASAVGAPDLMPTGRWVFVGTTFDGTTQRLYIDGAEVGTDSEPSGKSLAGLDLMSFAAKLGDGVTTVAQVNSGWLNGKLDEITFWDVALTPAQILEMQTGYPLGGSVSGLSGSGLVLQNNGGDDLTVSTNGTFTFPTNIGYLGDYVVSVTTQPAGQTCVVTNGTGLNVSAAVTTVTVNCTNNIVSVTVTAASPAAITNPAPVPTIAYTTNPSTVAGDWTAVPTCAVYALTDISYTTPLTGTQPAGTYATQCKNGTSATYNPTSYVPGTLVINAPLPTYHEVDGSGTANGRSAGSFTLKADIESGRSVIKDLTFVSKTDKIDLSLPKKPTATVSFDDATKSSTITGTGVLKGVGNVQYTVTVKDGGSKGKGDTFRLQIPSRNYDTGVQTLKSGDVNID